jgi:DNA uptake protein ComE-like DNA-binding protein
MMMVVAVMAEALHLYSRYGESPFGVNCISCWRPLLFLLPAGEQAENGCVPARTRFAAVSVAILAVVAAWSAAGSATSVAAAQQTNTTRAAPQASAKTKHTPTPEARVDINHASAVELAKVPGLTPSWAGRIVRFRPYRTKQDLVDRGVLPSDVYDRIKDYVIAHRDGK